VTGYTYELGDTPGQRAAAATLRRHLLDVSAQRLNEYLVTEGSHDAEWIEAATIMTSSMYMTVDELKDLYARIRELLDPYFERVDPSQRPPWDHSGRLSHVRGAVATGRRLGTRGDRRQAAWWLSARS
jgi:hypothetical protein